jgi:hypothetical protein
MHAEARYWCHLAVDHISLQSQDSRDTADVCLLHHTHPPVCSRSCGQAARLLTAKRAISRAGRWWKSAGREVSGLKEACSLTSRDSDPNPAAHANQHGLLYFTMWIWIQ